jgi:hypothetical protein
LVFSIVATVAVARVTACGFLVAPEARFQRDADRPAMKPHEDLPNRL